MTQEDQVFNLAQGTVLAAADWLAGGRRVATATLVGVEGSAPFELGATMLIDDRRRLEGSVTGGCVEAALVDEAQQILAGAEARVSTFGISDSQAADVGLMCGGTVHVLVKELDQGDRAAIESVAGALRDAREAALATVLDGERRGAVVGFVGDSMTGSFGLGELFDRAVARDVLGAVANAVSVIRHYGREGQVMDVEIKVFIHAFAAAPRMIIFGAIDFAAATARIAKALGYAVTICDAREPFIRGRRFEAADEIAVEWPDRYLDGVVLSPRDAVLVFTHDPKFDEPALIAALESGAGYVGALGSRKAQADRRRRLIEAGVSEPDLDRIAAPCGLNIGARTPEETAVSIIAEVIARSTGRPGQPLSESGDAIHNNRGSSL